MKYQPRQFLAATAAATVVLVSCGKQESTDRGDESKILAQVGEVTVTLDEFEAELERRNAARRPVTDSRRLLDEMVEQRLLLESARAAGLDQDPEVQQLYRNLLIGKLKERGLAQALREVAVSDDEIAADYAAHEADYFTPARARLAVVVANFGSPVGEAAREQARGRIEQAQALAESDADTGFKRAAAKFSDDQATRYRGGDCGWLERGREHPRLPAEVCAAAFDLALGELAVHEGADGCYLVKVVARDEPSLRPLESVSAGIRARLLSERRATVADGFLDSLRAEIPVTLFTDRLPPLPEAAVAGVEPSLPEMP